MVNTQRLNRLARRTRHQNYEAKQPLDNPMSQAIQQCKAILAAGSKSFALASKLLPSDCRDDAAVVYAWCRRVDDAIDFAGEEAPKRVLTGLQRELDGVYSGASLDDITLRAFQEVTVRRSIPMEYPAALLRGMAMDVEQVEYDSLEELEIYCFRVAGTVGLMMCHVMGVRDLRALRHAADLGIGMQLTNICRDVHEDWQRGRIYLPKAELARAGASLLAAGSSPLSRSVAQPMRAVVRDLLDLAEKYYASGDAGIEYLAPRCAFSVRAARYVYSSIGEQIARSHYDVLAGRAVVSKAKKLRLVVRAGLETLLSDTKLSGSFERAPLSDSVSHVANVFPL